MFHTYRKVLVIVGFVFCLFSSLFAYSGGSGTESDPYQIASVSDWNDLMHSSADWNKNFIMTADVNLQDIPLTPVGIDWETAFTGTFDGNDHIIRNVYINNPTGDLIGLFGIIRYDGQVRNLGVEDVNVTGNEYVGGLAGVYFSYYSLINCYATGTVAGNSEVGGLVGANAGFSPTTNCYAACAVSGSIYVGGFAGSNNQEPIVACYATGTVNGDNSVGGLVGDNQSCIISDSYATGKVTGNRSVGGLVGNNSYGLLDACYSVGQVTGDISVGGLVGLSVNGFYTASFWDVNTSGQTTSAGGEGKTTAQMQDVNTFLNAGWDFVDIWQMCTCGPGYPNLKWQCAAHLYSGGSGTQADPYRIATVCDWQELMSEPNDWNKHFIMTADVNLQGIPLIPVGRNWPNFNGVFDGNGHTIRNADINMTSSLYVGLFGYSNGQIRNLGVVDVNISGRDYTGGLVGYNNGTIIACFVTGSVNGNNEVGGLAGRNGRLGPTITDCYAMATVTGNNGVGGLAGSNNDIITGCYAAGAVSGGGYVGGLAGTNHGNITNSSSTGSVAGQWNLGGLVGEMDACSISSCFSTAVVTGTDNSLGLGGLVGLIMHGNGIINISNCYSMGNVAGGNSSYFIGGLVGKNMGGAISNCFATGDINGTGDIGGLIGGSAGSAGSINSSYFLITSAPDNNFGEPLTDEQMKQQTSFVGWDFVGETENGTQDIWKICNGTNYPKLEWQKPLSGDFVCPDGVDFYDFAVFANQWSLEKLSHDIAPPGGDGIVNFLDYALFASNWQGDINSLADFSSQWLKSGAYSADIAPAPAGDWFVNMLDLAAFADNWLKGIQISSPRSYF